MLHWLHPALVHFPIALLVLGSATEALGLFRRHALATRFGAALVVVGTLSLVPAILSGYLAANTVPLSPAARVRLGQHELQGWIVAGYFVALLFCKAWQRGTIPERQRVAYALALVVGLLLVLGNGLLGGVLVYAHGVGVAVG